MLAASFASAFEFLPVAAMPDGGVRLRMRLNSLEEIERWVLAHRPPLLSPRRPLAGSTVPSASA
jgi:hypothetical protein